MWKTIVCSFVFALIVVFAYLHGIVGATQNFGLPDFIIGCMRDEKLFLASFCEFFYGFLVKNKGDFLNVLGIIGVVLLTIMISVAVAIFNEKEKEQEEYKILDRNVMLEYVIEARFLLCYLGFIYVPIFFWAGFSSPVILQIVYLFLWGWGVLGMLGVLIKSYQWIKGDRFKLRLEYLQKLSDSNNSEDMKKSWRSFWDVDKTDSWEERRFFVIFSSVIDKLLNGNVKKIEVAGGLVSDFNLFIDKRSIALLVVFEEFFPKILEWHFSIWQKGYQVIGKKDNIGWGNYNILSRSLSFTLSKVQEKALKESESYSFFIAFESHVEKHKKSFVERKQGGNYYYVKVVISVFFDTLVKNIENRWDIWEIFPPEWKITSENIKKQENYVCRALCDSFQHWAWNRSNKSEYDMVWDGFVRDLFPSVCPFMWAEIFTFLTRGWENDNRMKSLIERPLNYGGVGRIRFGWMGNDEESEKKRREDIEKREKAEEEETTSLTLLLFGGEFTRDNLNKFIAELKAMKDDYYEQQEIEFRRKRYIYIFEKLLEARRKKDAEK